MQSDYPPRMDAILDATEGRFPRARRKRIARELLDDFRASGEVPSLKTVADFVLARSDQIAARGYRPVINGTGVILHTGLGRAPLGVLSEHLGDVLWGYSVVEVDRDSGERNQREQALRTFLRDLTGAENATVVNNNAGATMLVLAAMARGREVIVSRSELVEIGGGFRIPQVMEESGARLREVGTTNRTRLADYEEAIGESTGLLLKVHRSNFRIVGFTEEVGVADLVRLGHERGIPVVYDLGSGCLLSVDAAGIRDEPVVSDVMRAGVDLAFFSGDKLLGGPQAGIILGRDESVRKVRRHPLFRALRPGKLTLTALEDVLRLYWLERSEEIPVHRLIFGDPEELRKRAEALAEGLESVDVKRSEACVGSGAAPDCPLPSWALVVTSSSAESLHRELRVGEPSVFARVNAGKLWIDLRAVFPQQDTALRRRLEAAIPMVTGGD